jgi:hypothetical protein
MHAASPSDVMRVPAVETRISDPGAGHHLNFFGHKKVMFLEPFWRAAKLPIRLLER